MRVSALSARIGLGNRADGMGRESALPALKKGQVGRHIPSRDEQKTVGVGPAGPRLDW